MTVLSEACLSARHTYVRLHAGLLFFWLIIDIKIDLLFLPIFCDIILLRVPRASLAALQLLQLLYDEKFKSAWRGGGLLMLNFTIEAPIALNMPLI